MSFITNVLMICGALIAIALPISLQVNESVRKRYKSATLLIELEKIAGVNPKTLNSHLFLMLIAGLTLDVIFSLRENINHCFFGIISIVFIGFVFWFMYVLYKTYIHMSVTYQLVSSPLEIRNKLLSAFKECEKMNCAEIRSKVSAFMAIETNQIAHTNDKNDIDDEIKNLLYKSLDNLKEPSARCFVEAMLASIVTMMTEIIPVRENSVYCKIVNLYFYVFSGVFSQEEGFEKYFNEHLLLSADREFNLSTNSRPCAAGGVFSSLGKRALPSQRYGFILQYFHFLAGMCVEHQPDIFPSLIENLRQLILYDDDRLLSKYVWTMPSEPKWSCLWRYKEFGILANTVDLFGQGDLSIEDFSQEVEEKFKPSLFVFLTNEYSMSDIDASNFIDDIFCNLSEKIKRQQFVFQLKKGVLHYLAHLWCKAPEELIRCRELINPAGDKTFNVSATPVPSSIDDSLAVFMNERYFHDLFLFGSPREHQIVDVIAALFVYEILALPNGPQSINRERIDQILHGKTIAALKAAKGRVAILEGSFALILAHEPYLKKLRIERWGKGSLERVIKNFISDFASGLDSKINFELKTQKLDNNLLVKFKEIIIDNARKEWSELPLFHNISEGDIVDPVTYSWSCPRESFLSRTGSSDHYESDLARQCHDGLCRKIMFHRFHELDLSIYLPIYSSGVLIVDYKTVSDLEKIGFRFEAATHLLKWPEPSHASMLVYRLRANFPVYFTLREGEVLVKKSNSICKDGLPIDISHEEKDGEIVHKIEFWVSEIDEVRCPSSAIA